MSDGVEPQESDGKRTWTIGNLVDALRDDFPELSISKVRYLEDRGLLSPARSSGGYRQYGGEDLRRLRMILTLQRDQYLPLDIIKDRLEEDPGLPFSRMSQVAPLEEEGALRSKEVTVPEDDVVQAAGVDSDFLRLLSEFRLIDRDATAVEPIIGETDAEIVRACGVLAKHGIQPRNLRLLRSSAEREVALLEQVVGPALRSNKTDRRDEAERTLQNLSVVVTHLYRVLLYKELRRLVE